MKNPTSYENPVLNFPGSDFETFKARTAELLQDFEQNNKILALIRQKDLTIQHYHALLHTLFHQVYMSSTSFALAGVNIESCMHEVRAYLFSHAEEEQDHWKWIIENLYDSGYAGPDPREGFPPTVTMTYLSFASFLALKHPYARLAMGYVLEGISGTLGEHYGTEAAKQLGLKAEQMSFFIRHGQLDQGHSQDILDVLEHAGLTPYEWAWCVYAAECTQQFYLAMYDHAVGVNTLLAEPIESLS